MSVAVVDDEWMVFPILFFVECGLHINILIVLSKDYFWFAVYGLINRSGYVVVISVEVFFHSASLGSRAISLKFMVYGRLFMILASEFVYQFVQQGAVAAT